LYSEERRTVEGFVRRVKWCWCCDVSFTNTQQKGWMTEWMDVSVCMRWIDRCVDDDDRNGLFCCFSSLSHRAKCCRYWSVIRCWKTRKTDAYLPWMILDSNYSIDWTNEWLNEWMKMNVYRSCFPEGRWRRSLQISLNRLTNERQCPQDESDRDSIRFDLIRSYSERCCLGHIWFVLILPFPTLISLSRLDVLWFARTRTRWISPRIYTFDPFCSVPFLETTRFFPVSLKLLVLLWVSESVNEQAMFCQDLLSFFRSLVRKPSLASGPSVLYMIQGSSGPQTVPCIFLFVRRRLRHYNLLSK